MEQLLNSGKQLAARGQDLAEDKLGIPEGGQEREAVVSGLKKGAVAGGLLAILLGTKLGRSVTGKALKYGSLAALGTVAYQAYKNHASSGEPELGKPVGELEGPDAQQRSLVLLKAMISAAKADGHIDDRERDAIQARLAQLDLDEESNYLIHAELEKPIDLYALAGEIQTQSAAAEVYLASRIILDVQDTRERAYLDELATALKLPADLVQELDAEV